MGHVEFNVGEGRCPRLFSFDVRRGRPLREWSVGKTRWRGPPLGRIPLLLLLASFTLFAYMLACPSTLQFVAKHRHRPRKLLPGIFHQVTKIDLEKGTLTLQSVEDPSEIEEVVFSCAYTKAE
jgi:hypothetical protein